MKKTNKIIVTGGSGFIGSHLLKALGENGVNYDNKSVELADVNNAEFFHELVKATKPRAIVHLAAISNRKDVNKNPELALRTNLIGSFNVMRIAHKYNIPVIIASSAATYEPELSLYGTTKLGMESLAGLFHNVIIARLYNVYGKGSKSVVNKFIRSIKNGRAIVQYGNTTRDYIYVDDVIEAFLALIEADEPEKINEIGTGRGITLNKLISIIQRATKMKAKVNKKKAIFEIQHSECQRPSWYFTPLEQGIRRLL